MRLSYDEIAALAEQQAKEFSEETKEIKGYNVYFIDFGRSRGGLGYLVYKNGHQIIDDFANIHPSIEGEEELMAYYCEAIKNKLYTEDEIRGPIKSYTDYDLKKNYLHNYYAKSVDNISMFCIGENKGKISNTILDPVGFCYVEKTEEEFVKRHISLLHDLEEEKEKLKDNYEYQKSAFLYEMLNHEYPINYQGDYDTLSAFGRVSYEDTMQNLYVCFDKLGFTETQKRAYMDARKEALREVA